MPPKYIFGVTLPSNAVKILVRSFTCTLVLIFHCRRVLPLIPAHCSMLAFSRHLYFRSRFFSHVSPLYQVWVACTVPPYRASTLMLLFWAGETTEARNVHSPVAFAEVTHTSFISYRLGQDLNCKYGLSSYCTWVLYLSPSSDCDAVTKWNCDKVGLNGATHRVSSPLMPFIFIYLCFLPVWYNIVYWMYLFIVKCLLNLNYC